ncbi:hypothetical protein BVRB_2g025030 [Beta vulgaris subsp. vulgaris]|nr:hypothetical protein BVRB_2g025030 [Beta vulgaris subsp. vulgaris]
MFGVVIFCVTGYNLLCFCSSTVPLSPPPNFFFKKKLFLLQFVVSFRFFNVW